MDYWKNSNQKQRWIATSLLYIEGRLNRASGYKYLSRLREALRKEIEASEGAKKDAVAA
ncbi:MAG: hypothetical protein ACUZ77_06080 [Candidatus Brocadiales bacterium]